MKTQIKNGSITATLDQGMIIVEDKTQDYRYLVKAKDEGINVFGNQAGISWGEAITSGKLSIQNDDVDGPSHGQHGAIFIVQ